MDVVTSQTVSVDVNRTTYEREDEARRVLIHFLRDDLDLTGSHVGCDTGNCGACSVILDGTLVKSCMLLAVQADGSSIETVEALAQEDELSPCSGRCCPESPSRSPRRWDSSSRARARSRSSACRACSSRTEGRAGR